MVSWRWITFSSGGWGFFRFRHRFQNKSTDEFQFQSFQTHAVVVFLFCFFVRNFACLLDLFYQMLTFYLYSFIHVLEVGERNVYVWQKKKINLLIELIDQLEQFVVLSPPTDRWSLKYRVVVYDVNCNFSYSLLSLWCWVSFKSTKMLYWFRD